MRRRDFLGVLGGAAAWPLAVRAQQADGMRRIGVLLPANASDMKFQIQVQAFEQELKKFGWMIGRNVQIETRWATANDAEIRRNAAELVAIKPDVILAHGSSTVGPMQQATQTIPIVFPVAGDPVAAGFVESLARPGGQHHRFFNVRIQYRREVAGIAQADCASLDAGGCLAATRATRCTRAVWRDSVCCAIARGGGQANKRARCCIDRVRRGYFRARSEWRHDRDGGRVTAASSRSNHRTSGAAQIANSLLRALICLCWWPRLLRSQ